MARFLRLTVSSINSPGVTPLVMKLNCGRKPDALHSVLSACTIAQPAKRQRKINLPACSLITLVHLSMQSPGTKKSGH
jgi:hypothetical protein